MTKSYIISDKEEVLKNMKAMEKRCMEEQPERVNALTGARFIDCDTNKKTLLMEYTVKSWELNVAGILHGGVTCTMLDLVAGTTACSFTGQWGPTVDITVKFIHPGNLGDVLVGEGTLLSSGKRLSNIEAKLYDKTSGKLIASALVTYAKL